MENKASLHVPSTMGDLSGEISGLIGVCQEFEKRLGSVLLPETFEGPGLEPDPPILCGLAEQIREETFRLQTARRGLQRLLERVQL